ncbi:MAG TPA: NAD(P)-dependent oxidoreductase [Candidatus Andersenbacteria bacterium]|nr:NAD(P)-dependent oxidoreductase [Candidatus Andersenbacteria bacterium]
MSILFYDAEDWEQALVPAEIGGVPVCLSSSRLTTATAAEAVGATVVSVFSWSNIDAGVLNALPGLRHVATRSTGFDHIDVAACRARGVSVSNVPEYGVRTVAEHTFALMLALSRKILHCDNRTKKCDFSRDGLRGFDLEGKTLGIIGCGKIGSTVAEIARAFAMRVLVFDTHHDAALAARLGFGYVDSLEDLLRDADVISLHAPLTEETRGMIHEGNVDLIKSGALLINTARGDLVQTGAILKALKSGQLAGAGLDVLEDEKLIHEETEVLSREIPSQEQLATLLNNRILLDSPNVIITPHNAFNSEEAVRKIAQTTVENIEAFLRGEEKNIVT